MYKNELLVNISVLMPIPGCFHYCSSVIEFEVRDGVPPEVLLLYRIILAILSFLFFHIKLILWIIQERGLQVYFL